MKRIEQQSLDDLCRWVNNIYLVIHVYCTSKADYKYGYRDNNGSLAICVYLLIWFVVISKHEEKCSNIFHDWLGNTISSLNH